MFKRQYRLYVERRQNETEVMQVDFGKLFDVSLYILIHGET